MLKKIVAFLLVSILIINCKKEGEVVILSTDNYSDVINKEFTGDLAYETTAFVENIGV